MKHIIPISKEIEKILADSIQSFSETLHEIEGQIEHSKLEYIHDSNTQTKVVVAVHDNTLGKAVNLIQIKKYENDLIAKQEALLESRRATYKAAINNLPYGGGSTIIIDNQDKELNNNQTHKIKDIISSNKKSIHIPTSAAPKSLHKVIDEIPNLIHKNENKLCPKQCHAFGFLESIKASAFYLWGREDFQHKSILIDGITPETTALLFLLKKTKAKIFVSDNDKYKIELLKSSFDSLSFITKEERIKFNVDIYIPTDNSLLHSHFASLLPYKIIAPSCYINSQSEQEISKTLEKNNILLIPDFLINSAEFIYYCLQSDPNFHAKIQQKLDDLYLKTLEIFFYSKHINLPLN